MNILLKTKYLKSPSTVLNLARLEELNKLQGISYTSNQGRYEDNDIILFMCYDSKEKEAKKANPNSRVGIIDPRPSTQIHWDCVDFVLVNGIESADYFYDRCPNIFIYEIYPPLAIKTWSNQSINNQPFTIGYHGNKVHLEEINSRIGPSITRLADERPVRLKCIYNFKDNGRWENRIDHPNVEIEEIPWSNSAYSELASCHVGIIPNLIATQAEERPQESLHPSDYLFAFKATSNMGRAFPFIMQGVPIIADMFPSATQLIKDGHDGYVAYSEAAWYYKLKTLAEQPETCQLFAERMQQKYHDFYSANVQNNKLIHFVKNELVEHRYSPSSYISDSQPSKSSFFSKLFHRK
ncbi:MAG: hypothetical protein HQL32_10920 [Planctomycetes bacterium]|nr:hypothetical protein [Planctomycetota bacterium]